MQPRLGQRIHLRLKQLNTIGHRYDSFCQFTAKGSLRRNAFANQQNRLLFGDRVREGIPMTKRRWKSLQPTSLRAAMEACKDYAKECHNLSVERIADRMGLADHFTLYKWISTARMPAVMVPAYEATCGCNYVTRWLASSAGKLLIDVPTGRGCKAEDMQDLQAVLHHTTGVLMAFYNGTADGAATISALQAGLEALAWHRGNVQQHTTPQLELGDLSDE